MQEGGKIMVSSAVASEVENWRDKVLGFSFWVAGSIDHNTVEPSKGEGPPGLSWVAAVRYARCLWSVKWWTMSRCSAPSRQLAVPLLPRHSFAQFEKDSRREKAAFSLPCSGTRWTPSTINCWVVTHSWLQLSSLINSTFVQWLKLAN